MTRIHLLEDDEVEAGTRAVYDQARAQFHKVPNLFRTLAHHPDALPPMMRLFDVLYRTSPLDKRLIELGIIVISFRQKSEYCLTLHKAFALEQGATSEEIRRLRDPASYDTFAADEQAVLRFAHALADDPLGFDDAAFSALREHFDEAAIVNLAFVLGLGLMFGQLANALRIPQDRIVPPQNDA